MRTARAPETSKERPEPMSGSSGFAFAPIHKKLLGVALGSVAGLGLFALTAFHLVFNPPATAGRCDRCGGELCQREDDAESAVAHRLEVYASQTAPLLDYYRRRHLLTEVPGEGTVEQVTAAIRRGLGLAVTS